MELISPVEAMFLPFESREHSIHVGALQLFVPPEGAGPEFVGEIYREFIATQDCQPTFRKRHARIFGGITNLGWAYDDEVDINYHVRRSTLSSPGRVADLLVLTSRLHSNMLDRHRPLWELHLVEGLHDGRIAAYTKLHHILFDGVSALKLMQRVLSADPLDPTVRAIWNLPQPEPRPSASSRLHPLMQVARSVAALGPSTLSLARAALGEQRLTLPFAAPRTMFNVKIGGARRFAAQSWSLDRIKSVKQAAGVTVNDVVLAMCAGALRYYLAEQNALPDKSLVAMVPVSLRNQNEFDNGGNVVGVSLCNLATDTGDPATRLEAISASMRRNKKVFSELPRPLALALSAFNIGPWILAAIPGFISSMPPPYNIVISNVPGPAEPMYCRGARLDGIYPLSVALDGLALNITIVSNAGNLDFGLVGCPHSVPHLQRLLAHLEMSLKDLERATGV
jgi:diacylglycerol O-acyltransferase / wax synthase